MCFNYLKDCALKLLEGTEDLTSCAIESGRKRIRNDKIRYQHGHKNYQCALYHHIFYCRSAMELIIERLESKISIHKDIK